VLGDPFPDVAAHAVDVAVVGDAGFAGYPGKVGVLPIRGGIPRSEGLRTDRRYGEAAKCEEEQEACAEDELNPVGAANLVRQVSLHVVSVRPLIIIVIIAIETDSFENYSTEALENRTHLSFRSGYAHVRDPSVAPWRRRGLTASRDAAVSGSFVNGPIF
jgi:hypothetical protein